MMEINILGSGVMGKQIAALFYLGGFQVNVWDSQQIDEPALTRQIKLTGKFIRTEKQGRIDFFYDIEEIRNAITIESVIEDIGVKRYLYEKISKKITMPYFTNASSYSMFEIGENANAMHFFNPIHLGLVEVFLISEESSKQIRSILDYFAEINFEVIEVKKNRGYIGNYLLFHEISEILRLIEKYGYSIEAVSRVYNKIYQGRDVFSIIDLIGIDVVNKIILNLKEEDSSLYVPYSLDLALKNNVLGKKNGTSIRQILK